MSDLGTQRREAQLARAAEARRRALGQRSYPVLICTSCHVLTGWTTSAGLCDVCAQHSRLHSAFADPHGGWVSLDDTHAVPEQPHKPFRALLAGLAKPARARAVEWLRLVAPDETGPIDPEEGYDVEVAHRNEVAPVEGEGVLVTFTTATHRFVDGTWRRLEATRIARTEMTVPCEFAGSLPVLQLVDAWTDYQQAVHLFNARVWERTRAAREAAREAGLARADALSEQRRVSDLLQEDG